MPLTFQRTDRIQQGWRCSQPLRAFFEAELGPHFHFNKTMRDFIEFGVGRTLQEAIEAWQTDMQSPRKRSDIEPQFEYNRHVRTYFQQNPNGSLADAIRSWKTRKARRKSSVEND